MRFEPCHSMLGMQKFFFFQYKTKIERFWSLVLPPPAGAIAVPSLCVASECSLKPNSSQSSSLDKKVATVKVLLNPQHFLD